MFQLSQTVERSVAAEPHSLRFFFRQLRFQSVAQLEASDKKPLKIFWWSSSLSVSDDDSAGISHIASKWGTRLREEH